MPLWELLKEFVRKKSNNNTCDPWKSAICGAISGGISAALTTPVSSIFTKLF